MGGFLEVAEGKVASGAGTEMFLGWSKSGQAGCSGFFVQVAAEVAQEDWGYGEELMPAGVEQGVVQRQEILPLVHPLWQLP